MTRRFVLTIDCDSAAFGDPIPPYKDQTEESQAVHDEWSLRQELARILQVAAVQLGRNAKMDDTPLLDIDGLPVGGYCFTEVDA